MNNDVDTLDVADVTEVNALDVTKRSVYGIFALTSRTFLLQLVSFVAFVLIASKLSVQDIGIYTAVTAIQRVISFITDFGFGAALVQKRDDLVREDLTTTFTLQFFLTLFIFLIVFLLNPFFKSFFHLSQAGIYLLLSLVFSIFLSSFKTIPSILLERTIQFNKVILPQIAESLAFNIVLIILVLSKFGLNSYTWAFLAAGFISIPIYYYLAPWPVAFGISRSSLRHLRFGLQFQAKNILATIKDDFLTVILTKFLSYVDIGYIGFAQRLSFFVYRFIVDSVTKVTFSSYARIQHDTKLLRTAIEKSLFYVSACMFPLLTGLILISPYIIAYYPKWHNKWEPALFSLVFFSLNAMISSMSGILVNVLDSNGKVKVTLQLMVFWTILTWILTPLAIHLYGYNGVALASFIVTLTIVVTIYLVKKVVMFSFWKSIILPLSVTIVMGIATYIMERAFVHDIITLVLVIIISGLIYCAIFYSFAHDEVKKDFINIRRKNE
ncbi:MAG TPA: oligosaccharide flippase family protein [Patescibacteria group bacterium]|nr:oligosaccharide flippase family protein [Patescibacteria group bacterium]